jgi:hypothetical protein
MEDDTKYLLRTVFVMAIYWVSLWYLGAVWWKAFVVALLSAGAFMARLAPWVISRGAVALLMLTMLIWVEVLPSPSQWKALATAAVTELKR